MSVRDVRIGLLGCGGVGRGVVELIARNADTIAARTGLRPRVTRILVRDLAKPRGVDPALLTDRPRDVVRNGVDVVVEALGGDEPALSLLTESLDCGKPVVTANKRVVAGHHQRLLGAAGRRRLSFGYEACVCAGVPVVRSLRQALAADRLTAFEGVVNGTTNFILTRMEEGESLPHALVEAQRRGFAEPDPRADLEGLDAAQKTTILCGAAFGVTLPVEHIRREGITRLETADLAVARRLGYAVRLVARAEFDATGSIRASVGPEWLPKASPLARVRDEENLLVVCGEASGVLLFQGRGAGPEPTASALVADVLDAAANRDFPLVPWRIAEPAAPKPVSRYLRVKGPVGLARPQAWLNRLASLGIEVRTIEFGKDPMNEAARTVRLLTGPCGEPVAEELRELAGKDGDVVCLPVREPHCVSRGGMT